MSLDVIFLYFVIATNQIIFSKSVVLLTALSIFRLNFELLNTNRQSCFSMLTRHIKG